MEKELSMQEKGFGRFVEDSISPRLREKLTECLAEQLAPLEFHSAIV